jgi:hypothetical protein
MFKRRRSFGSNFDSMSIHHDDLAGTDGATSTQPTSGGGSESFIPGS